MQERFPNPETTWHSEREDLPKSIVLTADSSLEETSYDSDAYAVLSRVPKATDAEYLSGGLANTSILIDSDSVLRIYKRDVESLPLERQLLERGWQSFQTPQVLDTGDDFLLIQFVPHHPLQNTKSHGRAVGAALAEIHRLRYQQCGDIDGGRLLTASGLNNVKKPWESFPDAMEEYIEAANTACSEFQTSASSSKERTDAGDPLLRRCLVWFQAQRAELTADCEEPVLLHGDFKASNLHWSSSDRLLVLDWEFAYAGPSLMDIGQLFRWGASQAFREGFRQSYAGNGGKLCDNWERKAQCFDLVNLVGLLKKARPDSQQEADCRLRIEQTLKTSIRSSSS